MHGQEDLERELRRFFENLRERKCSVDEIKVKVLAANFVESLPELIRFPSVNDMKVGRDRTANFYLQMFREKHYVAFKSSPNGNCFFNALSVRLFGNESFSLNIKYITLKYIVNNYENLKIVQPSVGADTVDETLIACAYWGGYSNLLTMHCAAAALNVGIINAFAPFNGICESNFCHVQRTFNLRRSRATCYIFWYPFSSEVNSSGQYNLNHFVPLIRKNSVPEDQITVYDSDEAFSGAESDEECGEGVQWAESVDSEDEVKMYIYYRIF